MIDDIFSALDVPVAMQIYKYCIQGLLKRKTRIVCTHHPRFLSNANEIFVLENGKIIEQGGPTQVLSKLSHQFRDDIETDRFHRRTRNRLRQLSTSTGKISRNKNIREIDFPEKKYINRFFFHEINIRYFRSR